MINLLSKHEFKGSFWLPENQPAKCFATLSFDPTAYATLSAYPHLEPKRPFTYKHTFPAKPIFQRAYGIVDTGENVQMEDLFLSATQVRSSWYTQSYVTCKPIVMSTEYTFAPDMRWKVCQFELNYLRYFFDEDPVKISTDCHSRITDTSLDPKLVPELELKFGNYRMSFKPEVVPTFVSRESVTQLFKYRVYLTCENTMTLESILKIVTILKEYLSVITLTPFYVSKMRVYGVEKKHLAALTNHLQMFFFLKWWMLYRNQKPLLACLAPFPPWANNFYWCLRTMLKNGLVMVLQSSCGR